MYKVFFLLLVVFYVEVFIKGQLHWRGETLPGVQHLVPGGQTLIWGYLIDSKKKVLKVVKTIVFIKKSCLLFLLFFSCNGNHYLKTKRRSINWKCVKIGVKYKYLMKRSRNPNILKIQPSC